MLVSTCWKQVHYHSCEHVFSSNLSVFLLLIFDCLLCVAVELHANYAGEWHSEILAFFIILLFF